jgi:hypothetical protein
MNLSVGNDTTATMTAVASTKDGPSVRAQLLRASPLGPVSCVPSVGSEYRTPVYILPPEVWSAVFLFATGTPPLMDTSPIPPLIPDYSGTTGLPYQRKCCHIEDKISLSLVCKLWNRLALEVLYEYISIRSDKALYALLHVLERNSYATTAPTTPGSARHGPEWYVKHMSLYLNGWQNSSSVVNDLDYLLDLCPDIRILSINETTDFAFGLSKESVASRAPSLRCCRIGWRDNYVPSNCPALLKELGQYAILEILHLEYCDRAYLFPQEALSFPLLHTLVLEFRMRSSPLLKLISAWNLPVLSSLTLSFEDFERLDHRSDLETVIRLLGSNLTAFEIDSSRSSELLPMIGRYCPSLQDLRVNMSCFAATVTVSATSTPSATSENPASRTN